MLKIVSASSVAYYVASKVKTPITDLHDESVGEGACSQDWRTECDPLSPDVVKDKNKLWSPHVWLAHVHPHSKQIDKQNTLTFNK